MEGVVSDSKKLNIKLVFWTIILWYGQYKRFIRGLDTSGGKIHVVLKGLH